MDANNCKSTLSRSVKKKDIPSGGMESWMVAWVDLLEFVLPTARAAHEAEKCEAGIEALNKKYKA